MNNSDLNFPSELKWESYGLITENTKIIIKPYGALLPTQRANKINFDKFKTYDRNTVERYVRCLYYVPYFMEVLNAPYDSLALSIAFNLTLSIPHWEMKPAQKILIHGPSGVGKSSLVKNLAVDAGIEVSKL